MRKKLLWEKILEGFSEIEKNLKEQILTEDQILLERHKHLALSDVLKVIDIAGNSTEKVKLTYQLWQNRGKNRRQTAEDLGTSTDNLRSRINFFNSKLEYLVGENVIEEILQCQTEEELNRVLTNFSMQINNTWKKGYFK